MAEEEKSQKIVETYKAVAAGVASVAAAVFTSKLGVAGTLIGTALTAVVITLISAVLKIQLMKASDTIAGIPSAVQGRLSTQQIRIPGKPNPEPNPEPAAQPEAKGRRLSGLLSRLRALPGFFRELPSNQRRRMLLAGLLAGLLAMVIGLSTVTGIELVGGQTLSCLVWDSSCSEDDDTGSTGSSGRRSGLSLSIFGGAETGTAGDESAPSDGSPGAPSGVTPGEQPSTPGNAPRVPQGEQQPGGGAGQPEQPSGAGQPGEVPRDADGQAQQPGAEPGTQEAEPMPPADQQSSPPRGEVEDQGAGAKKEDRG